MANISIDFQNGNRPADSDNVKLIFNFEENELNNQYLVKCYYKRSRRIDPEGWIQFNEFEILADNLVINKEILFNFVKDTAFQQKITFKCELHLLITEYLSENFSLR